MLGTTKRSRGRRRSTGIGEAGIVRWSNIAVFLAGSRFFVFAFGILHAAGDDDLGCEFFVDRRYIVLAVAIVEDADHGFLLALHDAEGLAFSPAVVADAAHFNQHLVTVHGVSDLGRRDEDVALELALGARRERAGFGDDEAVAVAVHAEAADDQILIGRGGREASAPCRWR